MVHSQTVPFLVNITITQTIGTLHPNQNVKTKEIIDLLGPEVHFPDNAKASIVALTSPALYRLLSIPESKMSERKRLNKQRCFAGDLNNTISMGEALSYPVYILIH